MATSISATVTQSVQMAGATFSSATTTVTGETAPIIETTIATSVTATISGVAFAIAKLQMLYMLSDSADCQVTMVGTGGNTVINLLKGVPYLWFSGSGAANPLGHDPITGMTVNNNGAQAVSTDFHARIVLSA